MPPPPSSMFLLQATRAFEKRLALDKNCCRCSLDATNAMTPEGEDVPRRLRGSGSRPKHSRGSSRRSSRLWAGKSGKIPPPPSSSSEEISGDRRGDGSPAAAAAGADTCREGGRHLLCVMQDLPPNQTQHQVTYTDCYSSVPLQTTAVGGVLCGRFSLEHRRIVPSFGRKVQSGR